MKKIVKKLLCAALSVCFVCLPLVACGNDNAGNGENNGSGNIEIGNGGGSGESGGEIADTRVTETEWKEYIQKSIGLYNYTETYSTVKGNSSSFRYTDGFWQYDLENGLVYNKYRERREYADDSSRNEIKDCETYQIIENGNFWEIYLENGQITDIANKNYKYLGFDEVKRDNMSGLRYMEGPLSAELGSDNFLVKDGYESFTYDEQSKSYSVMFDYEEYSSQIEIAFGGGYVTKIICDFYENGIVVEGYHYDITNMNKTSVTIPDDIKQAFDEYKAQHPSEQSANKA